MTQKITSIPHTLNFPETRDLGALQAHLRLLCDHFNWVTTPEKKFLLLTEEIGELAKAIRNKEKLFQEKSKLKQGQPKQDYPDAKERAIQQNLADEMADILSYLMDIANSYEIDLTQAYIDKMTANFSRTWE